MIKNKINQQLLILTLLLITMLTVLSMQLNNVMITWGIVAIIWTLAASIILRIRETILFKGQNEEV